MSEALRLEGATRRFGSFTIFEGADLKVERGECVALTGPSGAGKTSLLQIAGLLEEPTSGRVFIGGEEATKGNRVRMRRDNVGFIFQFHYLLGDLSAAENVAASYALRGMEWGEAKRKAKELLEEVDMGDFGERRPGELSGGERQRAAVARALAGSPVLVLADEPTGNLDPGLALRVFELLKSKAKERGGGLLAATHNMVLASMADRVVELEGGKLRERGGGLRGVEEYSEGVFCGALGYLWRGERRREMAARGSVNKVMLVGNLGADPEIRSMQNGSQVGNLRLATTEGWKDRESGERRERTEWHRVTIFNEGLCTIAERYLKKGSKVYVEGQLRTRKWTDRDGNDRYTTEVVLDRFGGELTMLDGRDGREGGGGRDGEDWGGGGREGGGREGGGGGRERGGGGGGGGSGGGGGGGDLPDDEIPF